MSDSRFFEFAAEFFPEFTHGDVEALLESFRHFDTDGNGTLDLKELEEAFLFMGAKVPSEELKELIDIIDASGSGAIDKEGWLKLNRILYPEKRREFYRNFILPSKAFLEFNAMDIRVFVTAWRMFDIDDSNTIDVDELKDVLLFMGFSPNQENLRPLIDMVDSTHTGSLIWTDFLELMRLLNPGKKIELLRDFYAPAAHFFEFTKAEIDVFIKTFREFDVDGSGSIDLKELQNVLMYMGIGISMEGAKKIAESVETNPFGELEFYGFLQLMGQLFPFKREQFEKEFLEPAKKFPMFAIDDIEIFVEVFRNFDWDGSGAMDIDELGAALTFMGQGCSPEKLKEIVARFDADKNGVIEWVEFLDILKGFYEGKINDAPASQTTAPTSQTTTTAQTQQPTATQANGQVAQQGTAAPATTGTAPASTGTAPASTGTETTTSADGSTSGWLWKLGGRKKTKWQKRWCNISNGVFSWGESAKKKKGSIGVKEIISITSVDETVHKKPNCFTIVTGKKTYFLYSEKAEDSKNWMNLLQAK